MLVSCAVCPHQGYCSRSSKQNDNLLSLHCLTRQRISTLHVHRERVLCPSAQAGSRLEEGTFGAESSKFLSFFYRDLSVFISVSSRNMPLCKAMATAVYCYGLTELIHRSVKMITESFLIQSNLCWEISPFALWKWPQKAGGLKSEVSFVINYHTNFVTQWP